jgi:hypothetical protein
LAGILPTDILMMVLEFYVEGGPNFYLSKEENDQTLAALILWRIYALYEKNNYLLFSLFCLGISIIVIAAVS